MGKGITAESVSEVGVMESSKPRERKKGLFSSLIYTSLVTFALTTLLGFFAPLAYANINRNKLIDKNIEVIERQIEETFGSSNRDFLKSYQTFLDKGKPLEGLEKRFEEIENSQMYIVKHNDSLSKIAMKYGVSFKDKKFHEWVEIIGKSKNPNMIHPGKKLNVSYLIEGNGNNTEYASERKSIEKEIQRIKKHKKELPFLVEKLEQTERLKEDSFSFVKVVNPNSRLEEILGEDAITEKDPVEKLSDNIYVVQGYLSGNSPYKIASDIGRKTSDIYNVLVAERINKGTKMFGKYSHKIASVAGDNAIVERMSLAGHTYREIKKAFTEETGMNISYKSILKVMREYEKREDVKVIGNGKNKDGTRRVERI